MTRAISLIPWSGMVSPRLAPIFFIFLFTQILGAPLHAATAPLHYRIIDLGPGTPAGLNDQGQVILNTSTDAYLYTSGTVTDLGSLTASYSTLATSINNSGQITLTTRNGPFLYTGGAVRPFPLPPGVVYLYVEQINNLGETAGIFANRVDSDPLYEPFLSTSGTFTDLTPIFNTFADPPYGLQITRLNDAGQILGSVFVPPYEGAIRDDFVFTGGSVTSLGAGSAASLNNIGDVAKTAPASLPGNSFPKHAFLIVSGVPRDLGVLPGCDASSASGLNDSDDVVGLCTSHSGQQVSFLYNGGRMLEFADLVPEAYAATFTAFTSLSYINNLKWITGSGTVNGATHAFLAIPFPGNSPDEGIGDLVVAQGDIAPGCGEARFSACGSPSLDSSGNVAFRATLMGGVSPRNDSGIWLYSGSVGALVARNSLSPFTGPSQFAGAFSKFSDPVIGGSGCVAFFASLQPGTGITTPDNEKGVWTFRDSTLTEIAREGGAAPGLSQSQFSGFQQIAVSDSGAATFSAQIRNTGSRPSPITTLYSQDLAGDLHLLSSAATASTVASIIPFRPGAHLAGQPCCFDPGSGNIAILERCADGFSSIKSFTAGSNSFAPQTLLNQKAPASWLDYPFSAKLKIIMMGEPRINAAGTVAALTTLDGLITSQKRHEAIVLASGTAGHVVIQRGDPLGSGVLAACGDPAIDAAGDVAFFAISGPGFHTTGPAPGVWTTRGGMHHVALAGDSAPGITGATFGSIDQFIMTDAGDIAILGTIAGASGSAGKGIWKTGADGSLNLIVKQNDFLYVHGAMKPVADLNIFSAAPITAAQGSGFNHATGQLLYKAAFNDGTWALFTASP